jgi:hypothetical protein
LRAIFLKNKPMHISEAGETSLDTQLAHVHARGIGPISVWAQLCRIGFLNLLISGALLKFGQNSCTLWHLVVAPQLTMRPLVQMRATAADSTRNSLYTFAEAAL